MTSSDQLVIACNFAEATSECRKGALAYGIDMNPGMSGERVFLYARSRGGRWIRKWERRRRLTNFRVKVIPITYPARRRQWLQLWPLSEREILTLTAASYQAAAEAERQPK